MGNRHFASQYTTDEELINQVNEERLLQLAEHQNAIDVSLEFANTKEPFRHLYTIMLNHSVPKVIFLL
jgi:hypothetical protein